MPELRISYKNPKVKKALTDISKYFDFKIIEIDKNETGIANLKKKKVHLIKQIEKGLSDVKKIKQGNLKGLSVKEMLNEK